MERRNQPKTYKVVDLRIATFLKLKGFRLLRIDKEGNGRGAFIFEDEPERNNLILSFVNKKELCEPVGFLDELKNLKAMVREN